MRCQTKGKEKDSKFISCFISVANKSNIPTRSKQTTGVLEELHNFAVKYV